MLTRLEMAFELVKSNPSMTAEHAFDAVEALMTLEKGKSRVTEEQFYYGFSVTDPRSGYPRGYGVCGSEENIDALIRFIKSTGSGGK